MYYWYINQRDSEIEIRVSEQQNVPEEGVAASGESECISSVIDAIRTNAVVTKAAVDKVKLVIDLGPEKLTEDVLRQLETHLDKQIFFGVFESDSPELSAIGNPIAARNRVIPHYNVDTKANDFEPWSALMQAYVDVSSVYAMQSGTYDYFCMGQRGNDFKGDFSAMGKRGFSEYLRIVAGRAGASKLDVYCPADPSFISVKEQLDILYASQIRDDEEDAGEDDEVMEGDSRIVSNIVPLPFMKISLLAMSDSGLDFSQEDNRAALFKLLLANRKLSQLQIESKEKNVNPEDFDKILKFLKHEDIRTFMQALDLNDEQQAALDNVVARNILQKNIVELEARVEQSGVPDIEAIAANTVIRANSKKGKVRRAKIDPKQNITTQHQHQQVVVQRQQQVTNQQQVVQKTQDDCSAHDNFPVFNAGEFISAEVATEQLHDHFFYIFSTKSVSKGKNRWGKDVVGTGKTTLSVGQKIDFMTPQAAGELIKHTIHFRYGLNLDNLPLGFYVAVHPEQKCTILCYDAYRFRRNENFSPLTISYSSRAKWACIRGDARQFADEMNPAGVELSAADLKTLAYNKSVVDDDKLERQQQLLFSLMQAENQELADERLFTAATVDFNHENFAALLGVFVHYGCYGVNHFLRYVEALRQCDAELFNVFKRTFLADSQDYSEFLSADAIQVFESMLVPGVMDGAKLTWWNTLVTQHFVGNDLFDDSESMPLFQDLWAAFEYFCNELKNIRGGLVLPRLCSLQGVRDMRVGLDRLLYILKRAADPEEQLLNISGLELGNEGAYFAVRYDNFNLVCAEMQLTNRNLLNPEVLTYKINVQQLGEICSREGVAVDDVKHYFYRYIGLQNTRREIDFYRSLIEKLTASTLTENVKARILLVLARATTGMDNSKSADIKTINELLRALETVKPDRLVTLLAIMNISASMESAPSLNSFKQLVTVLSEYKSKSLEKYRRAADNIKDRKNFSPEGKSQLLKVILATQVERGDFDGLIEKFARLKESQPRTFQNILSVLARIDISGNLPSVAALDNLLDALLLKQINSVAEARRVIVEQFPTIVFNVNEGNSIKDSSQQLATALQPIVQEHGRFLNVDVDRVCKQLASDKADDVSDALAILVAGVKAYVGVLASFVIKEILDAAAEHSRQKLLGALEKLNLVGDMREKLQDKLLNKLGSISGNDNNLLAAYNEFVGRNDKLMAFVSTLQKVSARWSAELTKVIEFVVSERKYSFAIAEQIIASLLSLNENCFFIAPVIDVLNSVQGRLDNASQKRVQDGIKFLVRDDNELSEKQFKLMLRLLLDKVGDAAVVESLRELCTTKARYGDKLFETVLALLSANKLEFNWKNVENILGEHDVNNVDLMCGLLYLFRADAARLNEALLIINNHQSKLDLLKVVVRACLLESDNSVVDVFKLLDFLRTKDQEFLTELAQLYDAKPYPTRTRLLAGLGAKDVTLKQFIVEYECDPFSGREQEFTRQFAISRVDSVIANIIDLNADDKLSADSAKKLNEYFHYINGIGGYFPVAVAGTQVEKSIKDFTHAEIVAHAKFCQQIIRDPDKNNAEKSMARLEYLALLREVTYRTTGKFPYSTQIITVLNMLMQPGSVLSEVNTGEGKSIVSALNAAMLWVEGQTVDVCSSDLVLSQRDYEKFKDFYDYLGIDSALVSASSPAKSYRVGGINYSDVANLSLYRSRAKISRERMHHDDSDNKQRVSLVQDESDAAILDQRTIFNFSMNLDEDIDPDINMNAWVYPLIMDFVKTDVFDNMQVNAAQDIDNVRAYLSSNGDTQQRRQLENIKDEQLDRWLDSACEAGKLKESVDYVVQTEDRSVHGKVQICSVARVLIDGRPSEQTKWSFGVHQMLHARLNKNKSEGRPEFFCEPETAYIDSKTSRNFIDHYHRKGGRIIGMTGTIGSADEIKLQKTQYNFAMFKIPPHRDSRRVDLAAHFTRNVSKQVRAIGKIIKGLRSNNPVLVICEDIPSAQEMYSKLDKKRIRRGYSVQLVDGTRDAEIESKLIANAAKDKVITVATPILGRGTDIIPGNSEGLLVIQTFVATPRETQQIQGRAGRQGQSGHTVSISNLAKMRAEANEQQLSILQGHVAPKAQLHRDFAVRLQSDAELAAAAARKQTEEVGEIKCAILWAANKWIKYFYTSENAQLQACQTEALQLRESLNCKLDDLAREIRDEPEQQEGFVDRYKMAANIAWGDVCLKYKTKVINLCGADYQFPDNLQVDIDAFAGRRLDYVATQLHCDAVELTENAAYFDEKQAEADKIRVEIAVIERFQKKNPLSRLLLSQIGKGPNVANNRAEMLLHCKPDSKAVAKYFLGSQRRREGFKYSELLRIYDNYPAANKVIGARDRMLATKLETSILWRQVSNDPEVRKVVASYGMMGKALGDGAPAPMQKPDQRPSGGLPKGEYIATRNDLKKEIEERLTGEQEPPVGFVPVVSKKESQAENFNPKIVPDKSAVPGMSQS